METIKNLLLISYTVYNINHSFELCKNIYNLSNGIFKGVKYVIPKNINYCKCGVCVYNREKNIKPIH